MNETIRTIITSRASYLILFAVFLVVYGNMLDYGKLSLQRPGSIHQWRQSDGASMALLFYQDGNAIWEPAIHNQLNGTGQAGGEFPLTYYTAGLLYHVFGPHEVILRTLHLLIFLAGVFALLSVLLDVMAYRIFALFPVLWFLHSPTLLFYANNFLPDGPAMGFALMGTALFLAFFQRGKSGLLYLGAVAFSLSALIKISMLVPFVALVLMLCYYKYFTVEDPRFRHLQDVKWKYLLAVMVIVIVPSAIWYPYIAHYNEVHHGIYFTTKTAPIWKAKPLAVLYAARSLSTYWVNIAFPAYTQKLLLFAFLVFLLFMWRRNLVFALLTLLVMLGCTAYLMLFFTTFHQHDYYLLTLMFVPLFIYVYFADIVAERLKRWNTRVFQWIVTIAFVMVSWTGTKASARVFRDIYMGWFQTYTLNPALNDLESFLEAHGIGYDQKVICLPETSPNRSLYLMNRKGWTGLTGIYSTDDVDELIDQGAAYGVVTDTSFYSIHFFQHNIGDTVGYHGNILVFKLKKSD